MILMSSPIALLQRTMMNNFDEVRFMNVIDQLLETPYDRIDQMDDSEVKNYLSVPRFIECGVLRLKKSIIYAAVITISHAIRNFSYELPWKQNP